jgi:hypothetical protein
MWPSPRNICSLLLVLVISCTSGSAAETLSGFSPEAWRKAVGRQSDNWSREPLLRQFAGSADIRAMSRAEIIRSLGEPGVTEQIYYPGEGPHGRIDFYRLSAKNDDSLASTTMARTRLRGIRSKRAAATANFVSWLAPVPVPCRWRRWKAPF